MNRKQMRKVYRDSVRRSKNSEVHSILEDIKNYAQFAQHPYTCHSLTNYIRSNRYWSSELYEIYLNGKRVSSVEVQYNDFRTLEYYNTIIKVLPKLKKLGYTCKVVKDEIKYTSYVWVQEDRIEPFLFFFKKKIKVLRVTTEEKSEPCNKVIIKFD